ncbi:retrovirus-related pol polyprotein from transposon TNT 1-94 [Tanacetum coccineum]
MCTYLKNMEGYKHKDFKNKSFDAIKKMFDKAYKRVNTFVAMDSMVVKGNGKKAESSEKEVVSKKRASEKPSKESVKRQKLEDDAEKAELKLCLEIVPHDDKAINIEPLATKYTIVDWETQILGEKLFYYQIKRADGSYKVYKVLYAMISDFDKQDLIDLYRLVMERFKTTRPEGYDRLLWGDLMSIFEPSEEGAVDLKLFTRQAGNDLLMVQIYVDDIIFASTNIAMCNEFANQMTTKFKMLMMRQMSFFLGLQISQNPRGIFINQSKYASEIVKKYGMLTTDSVDTPLVEKSKLDKDLQGKQVDATLYYGMIGSLMYLTSSRPDLIYAVCLCARYQAKPTEKHLQVVKRIFRYLKGTINIGLWYSKDTGMSLTAYADADHAGCCDTRHSISGSAQFLGDKLVSCSSKKQKCTAISSAEIPMYCDNKSAIPLCCNNVQHSRAKHIDVRYHFIKAQVEKGIMKLYFVRTEYQLADIFTKPLPKERFNFLIEKLGMRSIRLNTGKIQREPTFQVVLDALALTPYYSAFLITADVPEVYMHQFWDSIYKHDTFYRFKIDKWKTFKLTLEVFREIFKICPRVQGQVFDALPTDEEIISFLRDLGHTREIHSLNDVTTGLDKLCLSRAQILWGMYHQKNVDYVELLWEDFIHQIDNKAYKKQDKINKIGIHTSKDDYLINTLRFVSAREETQIYGAILPESLTSPKMKETKAYKTYLGFATRATPPKKARKFKKSASPKLTTVLVSTKEPTGKSKRVKKPTKKSTQAPARGFVIRETPEVRVSKKKEKVDVARGKGIELLSDVAIKEDAQFEEVRRKSIRDFHKTYPSGSATATKPTPSAIIKPSVTNKGTGIKPGVPDVTEEVSSESEAESWGNDDDDSNNDQDSGSEGNDQQKDSEDDKTQSDNKDESNSKHETDDNESGSEFDQEEDDEKIKDDEEEEEEDGLYYKSAIDDVDIRMNEPVDADKGFVQEEGTQGSK